MKHPSPIDDALMQESGDSNQGGTTALFLWIRDMALTMDVEYFVEWRKRVGLTQARLAEILNVNISAVKKWEGGARKLPPYIGLLMAAIEQGLEPVGREHMIEVESAD